MNTVTTVLKWLMFVAISSFFGVATFALIVGIKGSKETQLKINAALDGVNATLAQVNKPKSGELAEVQDVTRNLRLTVDNLNKAAIDERFYLEKQQPIEVQKFNAILDTTNTQLNTLGSRAAVVVDSLNSAVTQSTKVLDQSAQTLRAANKVISNPDIPATIANVKGATANLETTTASLHKTVEDSDAIVVDTKNWWHSYLYPKWPKRVLHIVTNAGESVAKFFF